MHEVKFDPLGFAIVRVYIRPDSSRAMIHTEYKVDTGANCTTIGSKRLLELDYIEDQ